MANRPYGQRGVGRVWFGILYTVGNRSSGWGDGGGGKKKSRGWPVKPGDPSIGILSTEEAAHAVKKKQHKSAADDKPQVGMQLAVVGAAPVQLARGPDRPTDRPSVQKRSSVRLTCSWRARAVRRSVGRRCAQPSSNPHACALAGAKMNCRCCPNSVLQEHHWFANYNNFLFSSRLLLHTVVAHVFGYNIVVRTRF
jgi:hypothetical protein